MYKCILLKPLKFQLSITYLEATFSSEQHDSSTNFYKTNITPLSMQLFTYMYAITSLSAIQSYCTWQLLLNFDKIDSGVVGWTLLAGLVSEFCIIFDLLLNKPKTESKLKICTICKYMLVDNMNVYSCTCTHNCIYWYLLFCFFLGIGLSEGLGISPLSTAYF